MICLLFCHLLLQMKKTTKTLTKTYSTSLSIHFQLCRKLLLPTVSKKSRFLRIKVERTLNHRVFICIPKTHANKPRFILPYFLGNWVVHQKSEKQNPITVIEVKHKLLHGGNGNKSKFITSFQGCQITNHPVDQTDISEPVGSSLPLTAQDFTCEKSQKSLKNIFLLIAHKPIKIKGDNLPI